MQFLESSPGKAWVVKTKEGANLRALHLTYHGPVHVSCMVAKSFHKHFLTFLQNAINHMISTPRSKVTVACGYANQYTHTHVSFYKYFVVLTYNKLLFFFNGSLKVIKCLHNCFILFNFHSPSLNLIHLLGKLRPTKKYHAQCHTIGREQIKASYLRVLQVQPAPRYILLAS